MFLIVVALLCVSNAHLHHHNRHLMTDGDLDDNKVTRCGTEEYMAEQFALDPSWKESLDEFDEKWKIREKEILSGEYKPEKRPTVVLPTVYHILYNQNSQNIPDSAIAYQNTVLQQDYAGTNADISRLPNEFISPNDIRAHDMQIRYIVDQTIRRQTSVSSFGTSGNPIKFDNSGGSNVVTPESRLNFWSGALSGGLLGYAQFPGGSSSTDGVVNLFSSLAPEVGNPPYNLGRTATHEIGHWINLRHIWGDTSNCVTNDFVDDTPPSNSANFGCPWPNQFAKRCTQNPYSQDLGYNYMDYSEDACLIMFTAGQSERAWASIMQYRSGFNPNNIAKADKEYINWLYFTRFEEEQDDNNKCFGDHILFYDNNLNENSNSNVYIYGCLQKTNYMSVTHMTDIKFIFDTQECGDGYFRASQDINEGNDGSIYVCYNKVESNEENENMAIFDITFIRDDDISKLNMNEWEINKDDNINPDGVKLNFAINKGEYYTSTSVQGGVPSGLNDAQPIYISIGVIVTVISLMLIGFILWKYVCTRKGFKEMISQQLNEEYGATTEMATVAM